MKNLSRPFKTAKHSGKLINVLMKTGKYAGMVVRVLDIEHVAHWDGPTVTIMLPGLEGVGTIADQPQLN